MIKYISYETLIHYINEFHSVLDRVLTTLNDCIVTPFIEFIFPEKIRSDESTIELFNQVSSFDFSANIQMVIHNIEGYCESPKIVERFDNIIREIVTNDDEALYVVSYKDLDAEYDFDNESLIISFTLYTPNSFAKS